MTPPPGATGGLLNAIVGSLVMTVIGVAVGTPLGMLAGTYMAEYGRYSKLTIGRALHQRHPALRAVDRHRPVRLRVMVAHDGAFLRHRRRPRARGARRSRWSCAPPRTCCCWCRARCARRRPRSACRARMIIRSVAYQGRARRHDHRRAAGGRPRLRRDRAAAVHRAQQPVLEHRSQRADGQPARRDLPVRDLSPTRTGSSSPGPARCSSPSPCSRCPSSRAALRKRRGTDQQ